MLRYVWLWFLLVLPVARTQHPGLPPWQPKPIHGVCNPGWYLHHTFYNLTCAPCPPGTFSPGNTSFCQHCPPGTSSHIMAAIACDICAIDYFPLPGNSGCISCSDPSYNVWADGSWRGWVTFKEGIESIKYCYDLDVPIFFGWVWLIFVTIFFFFNIFDGYIHKIAVFRNLRVTQAISNVMIALYKDVKIILDNILNEDYTDKELAEMEAAAVENNNHMLSKLEEGMDVFLTETEKKRRRHEKRKEKKKRKEERKNRPRKSPQRLMLETLCYRIYGTSRAIFWTSFGIILIGIGTILIFIYQLTHIFFQAMLIFRVLGNVSDAPAFIALMDSWAGAISTDQLRPFINYLFVPILSLLHFLVNLRVTLEISQVNLDCTGSQASFELLINFCLFCMVVVVIQADSTVLFSPLKTAMLDKYVQLLHASQKKRRIYGIRFLLLIGIMIIGPMSNPIIPITQYLFTMVTMVNFFSHGHHVSNPVCDQITQAGTINGDSTLALLTTILSYFAVPSLVWTAAKALYPSDCPPLIRKCVNKYRPDPYPRWCWHNDGIDPDRDFSKTRLQRWYQNLTTFISIVGLVFFGLFVYLDTAFYMIFYYWAHSVAHKRQRVEMSVRGTRHMLTQIWHAIRIPNRQHTDWRYVDHLLAENLPSFVHFYRLWIYPRAMRRYKLPRFFPKKRETPLPNMHWLGWKDVMWKIFQFLKLGLCGWWDERTLRDMKILHIEQHMYLQDILKEKSSCPREYFRDLLASMIVPRATLLRFIPQLTPVAFFIQQMASSPLYMAPWPLPPPSEPELSITTTSGPEFLSRLHGYIAATLKYITPTSSLESRIVPTDQAVSLPPVLIPSVEPSNDENIQPALQETSDPLPIDTSASLSLPLPLSTPTHTEGNIDGNALVSTSEEPIIGEAVKETSSPSSELNIQSKPVSTLLKASIILPKLPMSMNMGLSLPSNLTRVPLAPINSSSISIQPQPPLQEQLSKQSAQPELQQPPPLQESFTPNSHPTISNKILLPAIQSLPSIQPSSKQPTPLPSSTPTVAASQDDIFAAAKKRREKRLKRKGNHRAQLRTLEEELKKHNEEHVQLWPIYMATPYKFLHTCSLFPICYQGKTFAGPTWMWFMNLGQFALGMWMAFSPSVGSIFSNPALRGGLVFLTYAVILPSALSISLRASIPLGRFIGVEDTDFTPFKDFLSLFQSSTWDDSADDKSSIGDVSSYASSVVSDGDMDNGFISHGQGMEGIHGSDVENFLYGTQGMNIHGSNDLLNRAAAMMLDDNEDDDNYDHDDMMDGMVGDHHERDDGDGFGDLQQQRDIPINPW